MVLVVPTFVVSDKKNKAPVSLLRGRVFGGCEFHGRVFFRFVLRKFFDGLLRGRVFRRGEFHGVGFFWGASFTGSGFRGTGFSGKVCDTGIRLDTGCVYGAREWCDTGVRIRVYG